MMLVCAEREAMVLAPTLRVTQQYRLASTAARLPSTGISHHSLLPHLPPIHPSVHSQQQPSPWDCSSFRPLRLPGDLQPVRGVYGCSKDCLTLIPFRLPQFSCFSSDSDNCPDVGIGPLLQFPHLPRAGPVVLTLLFSPLVPSSC